MSPGGFAALLGATVVSLVVAGIVVSLPREFTDTDRAAGEPMFPVLSEHTAEQITVTNQGYTLSLARRDGGWIATDRASYPARAGLADGLLDSLAGMTRIEAKTDDPDWYGYIKVGGPDAPTHARGGRVVATAGEVLVDAIIGSRSGSIGYSRLGATFVRPTGESESWLVEGSAFLPDSLPEWFDQLFHLPATDVVEVTILAGDQVVLQARKPEAGPGDYILEALDESLGPPGSTANAEAMRSLTQAVVNVTFEDVRARDGLVMPPDARTVRFATGGGLRIDATPVEDAGRTWVIVDTTAGEGTQEAEEAASIQARVDGWAFALPERRSVLLTRLLDSLVDRPGENPAEQAR